VRVVDESGHQRCPEHRRPRGHCTHSGCRRLR
jgi:hypothetical protein